MDVHVIMLSVECIVANAVQFLHLSVSSHVIQIAVEIVDCFIWFLRATGTAVAHLSHRISVYLSICLSHGWISQKQCKLGSPNLHCWLPGRL